jgi:hypothetical protein
MKMTEEASKTLQMHGIDNVFGIIGFAMCQSSTFPRMRASNSGTRTKTTGGT